MTEFPTFYCCRTLMSYHPDQDLNRVTLYGPDNFRFVLYEISEERALDAADRCNRLAAALSAAWDNKKAAPKGG
jgi:hypothetical protein